MPSATSWSMPLPTGRSLVIPRCGAAAGLTGQQVASQCGDGDEHVKVKQDRVLLGGQAVIVAQGEVLVA